MLFFVKFWMLFYSITPGPVSRLYRGDVRYLESDYCIRSITNDVIVITFHDTYDVNGIRMQFIPARPFAFLGNSVRRKL